MSTLTVIDNRSGKQIEVAIREPKRGKSVFEAETISKEFGLASYDPGFANTAAGESSVSYIDGEKGELYYRGYRIEDIAECKNHLEVCYLLLSRHFPNEREYKEFDELIRQRYYLHEKLMNLFRAFPDGAHPMSTISSGVSALSAFYHDYMEEHGESGACGLEEYYIMAQRIIAKIPIIASLAYRHAHGLPFIYPDRHRYFTENFLYMMRAYPNEGLSKW